MKFSLVSSVLRVSFVFGFICVVLAEERSSGPKNGTDAVRLRKWLTQLFLEAEINFDVHPAVSSQCLNDYNLYKEHLTAQSGWAIRMLESSGWPTASLLAGRTTHLGNWDECLLVSTSQIKGKYCLVEGSYDFHKLLKNNSNLQIVEWPSDELAVWEILRMYEKNPVRANRKIIRWAVCMPSSCSNSDLEISLQKIIRPLFQNQDMDFQLHINQSSCHVKHEIKYPDEFYYAVMFFLVVIIIICMSTFYDTFREPKKGCENSKLNELFVSFSLAQNIRQLFHYSPKNDYGAVYAIKIVSIIIIIYGHRRIYSLGYPTFNPETAEINFKRNINYFELTHFTLVDIFFMLTGFLTFHMNFSSMSKNGFRYWIVAIIHRWMRLIPTAGALMVFFIYIFPYSSDGPLWNDKISYEVSHCKATWWTNMLALNNIIQTENQCLIVSWYMAADMQLAILGFGLLYITTKSRLQGWIAIILSFVLGSVVTLIVAYVNKFDAILSTDMTFLQDPYTSENFTRFYVAFYTRIGPYLVGAMAALITKVLNEKNFKFSTQQKFIGIILTVLIGEGYLYRGFVIEYEFNREYNALEHAFYAATYRGVYVLTTALTLCIYFTSGFSSLKVVYENVAFAAIGRLTYSAFLVNTILQLFHAASQKSVLPSSSLINRFWWVGSDVVYSYMFGVCLYLALEAPIANVSKIVKRILLQRSTKVDIFPTKTEMNSIRA